MGDNSQVLAPGSSAYHMAGLTSMVTRKPKLTAYVVIGLAIALMYKSYKAMKYKAKYVACANPKAGFQSGIHKLGNHRMGLMNNLWNGGGDHSGQANATVGYVPDTLQQNTAYQAVTHSDLRPGHVRAAALKAMRLGGRKATREGMYAAPAGGCKPGDVAWIAQDGSNVCLNASELASAQAGQQSVGQLIDESDEALALTGCGGAWDPAAVADTQALTALGAIEGATPDEGELQSIIDGDPGTHLGDKQLTALLYAGAP